MCPFSFFWSSVVMSRKYISKCISKSNFLMIVNFVQPRKGRQSINEMATVIQRAWRLYKIRKDEKEKKEKFSTMKKLSTLPVTPATPPSQTATSVRRSRSFGFFNFILMDFIDNSQVIQLSSINREYFILEFLEICPNN